MKGENSALYDNKRTLFVGNLPFDVKVRYLRGMLVTVLISLFLSVSNNDFGHLLAGWRNLSAVLWYERIWIEHWGCSGDQRSQYSPRKRNCVCFVQNEGIYYQLLLFFKFIMALLFLFLHHTRLKWFIVNSWHFDFGDELELYPFYVCFNNHLGPLNDEHSI